MGTILKAVGLCRQQARRLKSAILPLAAVLVLAAGPAVGSEGETYSPPAEIPLGAEDVRGLGMETQGLQHPKLDSALNRLLESGKEGLAVASEASEDLGLRMDEGRAQVQITVEPENAQRVVELVEDFGGEVTGVGFNDTRIQAWVPLDALVPLAEEEDVLMIRKPPEAIPNAVPGGADPVTEARSLMNVPAWHAAGYTGAGVKVGVIDMGFDGYRALRGTELPGSLTVRNFVDGETLYEVDGGTVHGTACAEIIHDIAPNATLYLAKAQTNVDLEEAMNWLTNTCGAHIISCSLGFYNTGPGDGTGPVSAIIRKARRSGTLWVNSAGNDRQRHWAGAFSDPDGDGFHNFDGPQEINYLGPGDGQPPFFIKKDVWLKVLLRWSDWDTVRQDFRLLVVAWDTENEEWVPVGGSDSLQSGRPEQNPTEGLIGKTAVRTAYGFLIQRISGTRNVHFDLFVPDMPRLDEIVPARSLNDLAVAPDAMTVGALDVDPPYAQEPYSSEGPSNGPGGTAAGGYTKPDIAGFANVSTESYAPEKFSGTSAAAPHVAGAAALIWSAYPGYSANQVESFLANRAVDMGPSGKDAKFGYGRLNLGAPDAGPGPTPPPDRRDASPVPWLQLLLGD